MSLRLGWALRWALGAGRAGAGRVGTAQAAWARGCGAHGRWGGRRWGAGAAGAGARWEWQAWARGAQASGRTERHGMAPGAPRQVGRHSHGRAQPARGHGMDAQGRAGRPAGRPVRAWCAQLGQVGCFAAPDSVFGLVRLDIFPESSNEHCSL